MKIYLDHYEHHIDDNHRSFIRVNENLLGEEISVLKSDLLSLIDFVNKHKMRNDYKKKFIQKINDLMGKGI